MTPAFDSLPKHIQDAISDLEIQAGEYEFQRMHGSSRDTRDALSCLEQAREQLATLIHTLT